MGFLALICCLFSATGILAAPPGEVGQQLMFASDKQTLSWNAVADAENYNLYRGTSADGSDLSCLVFRTPATNAADPVVPGSLFLYLVAAHNTDGEGLLGAGSDGSPRLPSVACVDDDGDRVRDDQDNCIGIDNPSQLDQDLDGRGDPCDPRTYTFENDEVGTRPADMTQIGGTNTTFLVADEGSDLGVGYDGGVEGVHDLFDRLPAWSPWQDLDIYLDTTSDSGETLTLELWSEGTHIENAGTGVRFSVEPDGSALVTRREGLTFRPLGAVVPLGGSDRLRLRLRKGSGTVSTLFVDSWELGTWVQESVHAVTDDYLLFGRGLAIANRDAGRRRLLRITGVPITPAADFTLARSYDGLANWKLFQRGPDGDAPIDVRFVYRADAETRLELRLVEKATGLPLPGFDFGDQTFTLPAAPAGTSGDRTLTGVPEGGNYDLEARLVDPSTSNVLGQDTVTDVAVGDVFLAAGQSNMCGYSGSLDPAEQPVAEVHLFGNDYIWKEAVEPMDSKTDQVDVISSDFPYHSLMLRFGKELSNAIGVPVAIIPAPRGGSHLLGGWLRDEDRPADRGRLYGSSIHRVLVQGFAHPIRGVLWYQGESDVGLGTVTYRAALEDLVADYRADLGNPNLFFANCQLATHDLTVDDLNWISIQEAQRQQAEADPLAAVVALVDLPRHDTVHLDNAGIKIAGERLARAVLDGFYEIPTELGPQLVSATFGGSGSEIELTYDKALSGGGDVQLFRVYDQNGPVTVNSAVVSGNIVTLYLAMPALGETTVSYGFGRDPALPWTIADDGSGPALCFDLLPVE